MKNIKILIFLSIFLWVGTGGLQAQNYQSGDTLVVLQNVDVNTTWEGVVKIMNPITVKNDVTLEIKAGTEVICIDSARINVGNNEWLGAARIKAKGTASNPIVFHPQEGYTHEGNVIVAVRGTSKLLFEYCEFSKFNNTVLRLLDLDTIVMEHCIFEENKSANGTGAAIIDNVKVLKVNACVFIENEGNEQGAVGFVIRENGDYKITNNLFLNNKSQAGGGDILVGAGPVGTGKILLCNNTHVGGSSDAVDGAQSILASFANGVNVTICNSIFANMDNSKVLIKNLGDKKVKIKNCNLDYSKIDATKIDTTNIYDLDPKFVDPSNDDFRLSPSSPLINKGVYNSTVAELSKDMDGNKRVSGGAVDLGAYEFQMLEGEIQKDTSWAGIVYIGGKVTVKSDWKLTIFQGTEVVFMTDEAFIDAVGVISAMGTADEGITFHPIEGTVVSSCLKISKDGSALEYCDISNFGTDTSDINSVALQLYNSASVTNCTFTNNVGKEGGAIYVKNSEVVINSCVFQDNKANKGGALCFDEGVVKCYNSLFIDNSAQLGGDVCVENTNTASFIHNTHWGSYAPEGGCYSLFNSEQVTILNSILDGQSGPMVSKEGTEGSVTISHSNVKGWTGNEASIIAENITDYYPEYVDTVRGCFKLQLASPLIDKGYDTTYFGVNTDLAGNERIYGPAPDLGAYELIYRLTAEAGPDTIICSSEYKMNADSTVYEGTWSVASGSGDFVDVHDHNTKVTNLSKGKNIFTWTVSNGVSNISDDVEITNVGPDVNAGDDVQITSNSDELVTTAELQASALSAGETGVWQYDPSLGIVVSNSTEPNTTVSNIPHGETVLNWVVTKGECVVSDEVTIANGYVFNSVPSKSAKNWTDPTAWDVPNKYPKMGDSVSIKNAEIIITSNVACSKLSISESGTLEVKGSDKALGRLRGSRIFVEQTVDKSNKKDGKAGLKITNGIVEVIENPVGLTTGLYIGSNGYVLVKPAEGKRAELHIKAGKSLILGDGNSKRLNNADLYVRDGGRLFVEQTVDKGNKNRAFSRDMHIRDGGRLFVEQTVDKENYKNRNLSEVVVGRGRRIFVEQTVDKKSATFNCGIRIRGGRLFVEQTVDKGFSYNDLVIGRGSRIFVEQTVDKDEDITSLLEVPRILIKDGGQLVVGNEVAGKNKAAINCRVRASRIFVEQTVDKDVTMDTVLLVNTGSEVIVEPSTIDGELYQSENTIITVKDGGAITTVYPAKYVMETGSSLVDENEESEIVGVVNSSYDLGCQKSFSSPFTDLKNYKLEPIVARSWDESTNELVEISDTMLLTRAKGYLISNETGEVVHKTFSGVFNSGNVIVELENANSGVNLIGNPYPSPIDWDETYAGQDIQSAFYIYDYDLHNYKVYQPNGLNFYQTTPLIEVGEAFFVVAPNGGTFNFSNKARKHFYTGNKAKAVNNSLILSVSNSECSDQMGLILDASNSDAYELTEDAIELEPIESVHASLYSVSSDNYNLTINSCKIPDSTSFIPVVFSADVAGSFTIQLDENQLLNQRIYLYDTETMEKHELTEAPQYTFTYNEINTDRNFELSFREVNDIDEHDNGNVKIYSNSRDIHVVSKTQNVEKVEIYSVTGEKMLSETFNSSSAVVKTELPKGIYIVKTFVDNKLYTAKVVLW